MDKKSLELKAAKLAIERLKWEKMDEESISILLGIRYVGLALVLIIASLCLCEMGSNISKAINPMMDEKVAFQIERQNVKLDSVVSSMNKLIDIQMQANLFKAQPERTEYVTFPKDYNRK
jgi:hypothetical protein